MIDQFHAGAIMSFRRPAPRGAGVGNLLRTSVRLFQASLLKCLPLAMLAVLCASLPNIYWNASGHPISLFGPYDTTFRVLSVFGLTSALWLFGALMLRQRALALGAGPLLGAELLASLRRLPVLLAGVVLADLSMVAVLLLVLALAPGAPLPLNGLALLPGVFLLVCYLVLLPVMLLDQAGPLTALARSVRIMRPLWWQALTALVIAVLLSFLGALIFAAVLGVAADLLAGNGAAMKAVVNAGVVGFYALFVVYLSALQLVLHSAASSSA
jgi:hypothetical protein